MAQALHPDLDLVGTIRPELDILAHEIIIGLKKRSRFLRNLPVYSPGLVAPAPELSLLDYHLRQAERVHAELGRYTYASQEAFSDVSAVRPAINRAAPKNAISYRASNVGGRVLERYFDWLDEACEPGVNVDTFGQTVTADAGFLLTIMERVNLGKFVAESKLSEDPEAFKATRGSREGLCALIVKPEREVQVVQLAKRLAEHYEFSPEQSVAWFQWMIQTTVDIEVDYLQARLQEID